MTTPAKVVVYGAGGHARVVADLALCLGVEVVGLVDDLLPVGTERNGYRVVGPAAWLDGRANDLSVALGIGDNRVRRETFSACVRARVPTPAFVHPRATVSRSARLGDGCVVMAGAVINAGAILEPGVIVNTGAVVEHDVHVGEFAHVSPNATLTGGTSLGAFSHLGAGATVIPGVVIGKNTIVGAGAVVLTSLADGVVAVGVPAKVIKERP